MDKVTDTIFVYKWKSFKTFKDSGAIRYSTPSTYTEFNFSENGLLKIKEFEDGAGKEALQTSDWKVNLKNKKHYLEINQSKLVFEVITINHTVMVLSNNKSGEKIFFAKDSHWDSYLRSNKHLAL